MKLNIVPALTGASWVKSGIRAFIRQPIAMTALFFMTMAAMSVVSVVPLVGPALALALLPSATLAMMVASAEAMHGRFPTPAVLLVAFRTGRQRLRDMVVLGGLYASGFLLIVGISALFDGGNFAQVYLGSMPLTKELAQSADFQWAMWVCMGLYLPLSLLFWHAPGLVHWHGVSPAKSLFFSFIACVRNMGAFTVYGLAWLGVFAIGGIATSLLSGILLVVGIGSAQAVLGGLMAAMALMLAAMCFTSVVFTFRDCFEPPVRGPQATEDAQTLEEAPALQEPREL